MKEYCMYLRKSRADAEAEARGEGETLARHRSILAELANKQKLNVTKIYKEIVSGDSIAARPEMQALLADVAERKYAGVLVVEIERLARGDTIDQGIVAQAFRDSSTKIITPNKTYDPDNEFDEEYFEFSLFMSRREYKTINRRMQAGRLASVKEGNYISAAAPYGYRKISPEPKVHTLEIVPSEAETVRFIYKMYLDGHGAKSIANELNRMGISPQKNQFWEYPSIRKILSNHLYCGKVGWRNKANGDKLYKGLHEPIISEETFNAVQQKRSIDPSAQLRLNDKLMNHYHNILFCQNCGHQLKRRIIAVSGHEHMLCTYKECHGKVVSSNMEAVDEAVIAAFRYRISRFEKLKRSGCAAAENEPYKKDMITAELNKARCRLSRMYYLLEQEVYDTVVFLERSAAVREKITLLEAALAESDSGQCSDGPVVHEAVKRLEDVIDSFPYSLPEEKNRLLHAAIGKIYYSKTKRMCRNDTCSDLTLTVFFL
ncbi:MAG: recombinase family protein [Ruminococcus sp.]|nr:recombinase family protein [Ruminococcus sp.]